MYYHVLDLGLTCGKYFNADCRGVGTSHSDMQESEHCT